MNMNNFRKTIKSSLAGVGLATILACTGGGSTPDPVPPKPDVIETKLETGKYRLTNVSSGQTATGSGTVDVMQNDIVRYESAEPFATAIYKNGVKDVSGSYGQTTIDNLVFTLGYTTAAGSTFVTRPGNGTNTNTFDQSVEVYEPNLTAEKTTPLSVTTNAKGPPAVGTQYSNYAFTTQGPSMRLKPATPEDHTAAQANPIINTNYSWFAQALTPTKDSLGKQYDAATWEQYLRSLQDGIFNPATGNYEAVKYTLRPETNGVTFVYPDNSSYTVSFTSRAAWYPVYNKLNGK